ncbi:MAG: LuxR C-terminal-related transcriptional regulator [Sandaracinaceae bacterium]
MSSRSQLLSAPADAMIAVADAGYRLALDDETWLTGVLDAARPLLDHGSFVHGWVIELSSVSYRSSAAVQLPPGAVLDVVRNYRLELGSPEAALASRAANLCTASQTYRLKGEALARVAAFPPGFGIADCITLGVADPSGIGCALVGVLPEAAHVSLRDQARWGRVASHLAAALRLRERLRDAPTEASLDSADALIDPRTFTFAHVNEEARSHSDAIRAASTILAARHGSTDAVRLVAAWRALVAGRWSLVDTFDTDGKRFFVLRKNEPTAQGPEPLTPTQRAIAAYIAMGHSNKAIAYHLGLSESTVSRTVAGICDRLGLGDREHLAQLAGALGAHPEGAEA